MAKKVIKKKWLKDKLDKLIIDMLTLRKYTYSVRKECGLKVQPVIEYDHVGEIQIRTNYFFNALEGKDEIIIEI